ncbi:MAG: hypothetical protein HEP71_19405 [Roseivirga sp.]|nr:hypothetical protein [Roseivirga sp.]
MNTKDKYPRDKGRPIRVKKAKSEQARWKKNSKNEKYPSDTFSIPFDIMVKSMEDSNCHGVKFCNGLDKNGKYTPIMAAINGEGEILTAFDTSETISSGEFEEARDNWNAEFPLEKGDMQFFYLGEEAIKKNIKDFEINKYQAVFVEQADGTDSAVLNGYHLDGMKDPGDDEDPDTSLNGVDFCPPFCGSDN